MKRRLSVSLVFPILVVMMYNAKAGVVRTVGLSEGDKVYSVSVFGIPLELFIILVVIIGIAIVGSIVAVAIKKLKTKSPEKVLEEALQGTLRVKKEPLESKLPIELILVKGIGSKRAEKLKVAGVNTVSDLATSSAKDLSQKTGISEKIISRWIEQAKEIIE